MSLEPEGDCIGFQLQHDEVLCPLHEFPGMKMKPRRHPASERLHERKAGPERPSVERKAWARAARTILREVDW